MTLFLEQKPDGLIVLSAVVNAIVWPAESVIFASSVASQTVLPLLSKTPKYNSAISPVL